MSSRAQGLRLRSPPRRSSPPAKIVSALLPYRDPAIRAEAYRCAGYPGDRRAARRPTRRSARAGSDGSRRCARPHVQAGKPDRCSWPHSHGARFPLGSAIRLPGVSFIGNIFVRADPAWPSHGLRVGVAPALAAGLVTLAATGPRFFPTPSAKTTEPDDNGRRCRDRRCSARVRRNVSASARHPATASCTGKVVDASS